MTPQMIQLWIRMAFMGPATMNPMLMFWLNSVAPVTDHHGKAERRNRVTRDLKKPVRERRRKHQ